MENRGLKKAIQKRENSQPLHFRSKLLRRLRRKRKIEYQKYKASIYQDIQLDEDRYKKIISSVFNENDFIRQVEETKKRLSHIEPELVEEVIKFHISKTAEEITKVRPWKRIVYIFSWARIDIWHMCYNPYSAYFNISRTKKLMTKFKKEVQQILNQKK